ncbi:MAG: site-2 protease family protein [Thermodesulfobacteriota bacterium]|jgi:Zn-dependent protease
MDFNLKLILIQAPVILFALTVHEFCHAWVADLLGDDTAKRQGRLTLNPIAHLDVLGTILMFVAGFGWAKPVPVNAMNFKDPRKGMLLVAIAGPASNLVMAIAAGLFLRFTIPNLTGVELNSSLSSVITVSLVMVILTLQFGIALAVFNMIPIPPLDGSRVLYALLPQRQAYAYSRFEPYGMLILFGLFFFGGRVFAYILWFPVSTLSEIFSGYNYFHLSSIIEYIFP